MNDERIQAVFEKYGQFVTGKDCALIQAIAEAVAPQRTWVELTDDDCLEALKAVDPETKRLPLALSMFAANIQAKLKDKNCG